MGDDTQTEPANTRRHLRKRVERALVEGKRGGEVMKWLESLSQSTPEANADALFAHRQLAELQLEVSPWRAALHLRQLMQADAADDGVHALMGLCQALLGNFSAAVSAYRRATRGAPQNPWYHHNLGHLLDVGAGEPKQAEHHLRVAHDLEPEEDEITASLAHCLARLGRLEEATAYAREALAAAPQSDEHRALLSWIEEGAPVRTAEARSGGRAGRAGRPGFGAGPSDSEMRMLEQGMHSHGGGHKRGVAAMPDADEIAAEIEDLEGTEQVAHLLARRMPRAGFSSEHVQCALVLWADYCNGREVRVAKPTIYAAAIEYAIAKLDRVRGTTQAAVAERYGVAPGSISNRYGEIRAALELIPGDPRYCASR